MTDQISALINVLRYTKQITPRQKDIFLLTYGFIRKSLAETHTSPLG